MSLKPTTVPTKRLAANIKSDATSFKVNNILGWDGSALTSASFGTVAYGCFRNSSGTLMELFQWDPSTVASASITILKRGLMFTGELLTEVTANKRAWVKGDTYVELGTHAPQLFNQQVIYKSADETVNNSTTLQNDDHILFPVTANEVWAFELHLIYRSGSTPDLKIGWSVPSGTTMIWDHTTGYDGGPYVESDTNSPAGSGASTTKTRTFWGVVFVSSTAGNIQLQWAQNALEVSDTKVLQGTHLIARRLA